ncbi:Asp/Glu racemase [Streptomyces oceani]|uniref:Asp/Glu racemase n=1 Tax=Streptomyces oceani TaxID=1075402 RepID=A0A1E7KN81_9ACTN|nr:Asp/Glu racemase [Streptomyces oceani]OEV05368.1 Asp/Glu racemase [Streptomyces oceani]
MGSTPSEPVPQTGVGVVASFDFNRDRELWRWVPEHVSLFISRTGPVADREGLALVRALNDAEVLRRPTREVGELDVSAVAYLCTACSFVGGAARERRLRETMLAEGAPAAVTTAGAVVTGLRALGARRVAVAHPYVPAVGERLRAYLTESGLEVVSQRGLGLQPAEIPAVSYARVRELVRESDHPTADAVFLSCTALPTYDVIAPIEAELGKPVVTANQATVWAVLRAAGLTAVGAGQRLLTGREPAGRAEHRT